MLLIIFIDKMSQMKKILKVVTIFFLIGMNISCDQITKHEVRNRIEKHQVIEVISTNLILTNVENTGAAMSLGANLSPIFKTVLLKILPVVLMFGFIGYLLKNLKAPLVYQFALACIIGGGLGNIFDRIKFNSVTDFMMIEIGPLRTGIFNMADVSIVVGVCSILAASLMGLPPKVLKTTIARKLSDSE